MKNAFKHCIWYIVLLFILSNCIGKKGSPSVVKKANAKQTVRFVANPKVIAKQQIVPLSYNSKAPDFELPGVDGNFYALSDFDPAKVLVVIFTCNHCPTSQAYENRIIRLVDDYKHESVQVVAISPNSVNSLLLEDLGYSDLGDSFEEMKLRAKHKNFNFPYLYDGDTQGASIKFGPEVTPQVFVFDQQRKLKYKGRIDAYEESGIANANELRSVIDAVLYDVDILKPETKPFGCGVRWAWDKALADKVNRDWTKMPVTLKPIYDFGLSKLIKNNSPNLRLINVWATWSTASAVDYPEFLKIYRMFIGREFEFMSINADQIDQKPLVLNFLLEKESAVQNYIYSGNDFYKLIETIDPEWNGALPYTALIEPNGQLAFSKTGSIDPYNLKKIILDHPIMSKKIKNHP